MRHNFWHSPSVRTVVHTAEHTVCNLDNIAQLLRPAVDSWLAMRRNTADIVDTAVGIAVRPWDMSCWYPRMVVRWLPCSRRRDCF